MIEEKNIYRKIQRDILIPILDRISQQRGELAILARRLEGEFQMKHAKHRLSELRSGKRTLSFYFLKIIINGGVMSVEQILRGRKLDELNPTEKDIVLRLMADPETLQLIYEAEQSGFDVRSLLKISLKRS